LVSEEKAQASTEYLVILVGVILIVVIVSLFLKNTILRPYLVQEQQAFNNTTSSM
jgi:uncharacterized protein (UPF0333 family)